MKTSARNVIIFTAAFALFMLANISCQPQNASNEEDIDARTARLIASENRQLVQQLNLCKKELENHKNLLKECRKQRDSIQADSQKSAETMLKFILEENMKLTQENKKLKEQLK